MKEGLFENSGDLKYLSLKAEEKFEKYLPEKEAIELAEEAYRVAQKVDALLGPVLGDPELHRNYNYDGMHFIPKNREMGFLICDGKNILRIIKENASSYFYGKTKEEAVEKIKEILKDYLLSAEGATAYWWKNKKFSSDIDLNELRKAFARPKEEKSPPPVTEGEAKFFESYEKQMKKYGQEEPKSDTTDR